MDKKYKTILIDPPWDIKFVPRAIRPGQIKLPYPTMSLDALCDLGEKMQPFIDTDCNMFLWATHKTLPDAFVLMKKWGFKYHVCITWDKTNGMSWHGFTRRTEFLLYGYKGHLGMKRKGKFFPSLLTEKHTVHSKKPQIVYQWIESNAPSPFLELFARNKRDGWDVWGDEVQNDIQIRTN